MQWLPREEQWLEKNFKKFNKSPHPLEQWFYIQLGIKRTRKSILRKAEMLGLNKPTPTKTSAFAQKTNQNNEIIKQLWEDYSDIHIAGVLGTTPTYVALHRKSLGLKRKQFKRAAPKKVNTNIGKAFSSEYKRAVNIYTKAFFKELDMMPKECSECGATENLQLHHKNYLKPLDVECLCSKCHNTRHWI